MTEYAQAAGRLGFRHAPPLSSPLPPVPPKPRTKLRQPHARRADADEEDAVGEAHGGGRIIGGEDADRASPMASGISTPRHTANPKVNGGDSAS